MKDYWKEKLPPINRKISKKQIIIISVIAVLIIAFITIAIIYYNNETAREWIDKNIFQKEVMQDNVTTIELKENEASNIYAFNKYIGVLNKNKFTIYGNTGNEERNLEVEVSNPIFDSANRFLVMAEKKGRKLYLITDKEIMWQAEVDGNISQVHVNKNRSEERRVGKECYS